MHFFKYGIASTSLILEIFGTHHFMLGIPLRDECAKKSGPSNVPVKSIKN
jgi:hypothetical protein